ncbi:amidase [Noviherbaspirillum massiliense]|uniref:amidase n=1 Tax=Noviherbaspirillum massiliense TaxID=1465823 RepID=UPI00031188D6|nr:amidase family protein [Noviherbaspirillum massiliense]
MQAATSAQQQIETDLTALSATEQASLVRQGKISSLELVEAHIARIEAVNPVLNAVVVKRYEEARAEAREADRRRLQGEALGPLHGVPVSVKECLDLAGTPSTFGLPSRASMRAEQDDAYVARLRAAGAIVLGKTNVAQLLMFVESDNPLYGRSNNPWDLQRTPGGSSGGEAAIIAAGGAALGLGTDIGGSVRAPAAFCGIASMKPTAGRLPDAGRHSMPFGQRAIVSQVGVLARHVADVALGLEVANGGREPAAEPPMPLHDWTAVDVSRLRVACYLDDGLFPVAPAVRRAVQEAATILSDAGARVTPWQPPAVPHAYQLSLGLFSADCGAGFRETLGGNKRDPRIAMLVALAARSRFTLGALGGLLRLFGQHGLAGGLQAFGHGDTAHYWKLVEAQIDYQERFRAALDQDEGGPFDLILCPAMSLPAWKHGAARDLTLGGAYSILYNLLGYPAGVVPVTRVRANEESDRPASADLVQRAARKTEEGSAGLPVGVQVVARPWREHVALAAMQEIERVARQQPDFPFTPRVPC